MADFSLPGDPVPDDQPVPTLFGFCAFMAAVVAKRRGGNNIDYMRECHDFMKEVTCLPMYPLDPLPDEYDWTVGSARECAEAMLEYD